MDSNSLTRHYTHDLSNQVLNENPNKWAAILYCALPLLFAVVAQLSLFSRNIRINHNFFVKTYPPTIFVIITTLASLISYLIMSLFALIGEAWTIKTWILYTTVLVLIGLAAIVYTLDTQATLVITLFIIILAAIFNEWLFIDANNMPQQSWKHLTRNLIGFNEAIFLVQASNLIGQIYVHVFKGISKHQVILFWITATIALLSIYLTNILSYGPIFDSIGYLIAAVFLLIGAFISIKFYKYGDEHEALNK